jgi:exopolyphosphatase / guanosine-5'-triphosphate,3'-diphosphate pyrophosphatase
MIETAGRESGDGAPRFPLRLGAIDMGSNAIRFVAAEFSEPLAMRPLESVRESVRLGKDAFETGILSEAAMDAAVGALCRFRERMDALEVAGYRAVATSAVRDSRNGHELIARVREQCGIEIETITGAEEARLAWLAVRQRVELGNRPWYLVDLGGGSLEVSFIEGDSVRWSESHPVGTVRLLNEMREVSGATPSDVRRWLDDHTAMLKVSSLATQVEGAGVIATGGNMETLAELAGAQPNPRGVALLRLDRLQSVVERLGELTPRERVRELNLREDRADVILPAGVIYERIARFVGVHQLVVPYVGVKDGLVLDVLEDILEHGGHEARLEREAVAGALELGRRYGYDAAHAGQVARLALALFDQLVDLHRLGSTERRVLAAAALLHDIGQFISYRRHHKHSFYLIANADLPGFTPRQILLVALVARYHRRAGPREEHEGYSELSRAERDVVERLAAILRIADALDREHQRLVSSVLATPERGSVVLRVEGEGDLLPERWAVKRKGELFESVFELDLRVRNPDDETE